MARALEQEEANRGTFAKRSNARLDGIKCQNPQKQPLPLPPSAGAIPNVAKPQFLRID